MSSTVIENTQPTDDRLEIVVRERSTLVRQLTLAGIGVRLPWAITLAYRIQRLNSPNSFSASLNIFFLGLSALASMAFFVYLATLLT
jgi:hypothetical protein